MFFQRPTSSNEHSVNRWGRQLYNRGVLLCRQAPKVWDALSIKDFRIRI